MKKLTTLLLALGVIVFLNSELLFAQKGKGGGPGPSANRGPGNSGLRGDMNRGPNRGPGNADLNGDLNRGRNAEDRADKAKVKADIAEKIERNPQQAERLRELLPANTDLQAAASGFKNQGQFIAALHVANNLNLDFNALKSMMTGENPVSLGKAIQELRGDVTERTANEEVKRAEKQAKETEKQAREAEKQLKKATQRF